MIAVRPERILLNPDEAPGVAMLAGTVAERYFAGDHVRLVVRLATGEEIAAKAGRLEAHRLPDPGDEITIGWRAADAFAFPPELAGPAPVLPKELQPA